MGESERRLGARAALRTRPEEACLRQGPGKSCRMPRCRGLSYRIAFFASEALPTPCCAASPTAEGWVLGGWFNFPFLEGSAERGARVGVFVLCAPNLPVPVSREGRRLAARGGCEGRRGELGCLSGLRSRMRRSCGSAGRHPGGCFSELDSASCPNPSSVLCRLQCLWPPSYLPGLASSAERSLCLW